MQIEFQGNNLQHLTTTSHWTEPPKFHYSLAYLHKPGCLWSGGEKWLFPAATDARSATWWQQFKYVLSAMGIWGMPWVLEMGGIFRILNGTYFIIFRVSNIEMQLWAWPSCADLLVKLRFKLALHSQQAEKLVKPKGLVYLTVGPGVLVVMDCYGRNGCWLGCGMFRMSDITTKSLRLWRD